MIHDLKPYPAYKDSGVPWLGEVPDHWEVKRNKLFLREINERSEDGSEELLTVSQYTGVTARRERISEENGLLTNAASLVGYKRVNPDDLVMNIMLAWNGSLGVSPIAGIASPAYCVYRATEEIEPRFLHYLFRTPLFTGVFKAVSTGVVDSRLRLYPEVFFRLISILPPKEEQSAIVHYLDHIDRRIHRYIRTKQKLIKMLEEQKQAIIHQAVTRGLDPNVKLKLSGVEWLGDVPEHWEVLRSRYVFREIDRRSVTGQETHLSMSQKYGLIRSDQIETRRLISESYIGAKICARGDLVLNRLKAHLGVFALAPEMGLVSPDYTVLRPDRDIIPSYFEFVYRTPACRLELRQRAKGIVQGFWRLYTDDFYQIPVPVPPKQEQEFIVTAIEEKTRKIKEIITRTEAEISLLHEYRTRLIADVVTGKLDVREAAANMPEETDETESFDDSLAEDEELENNEIEDDQAGKLEDKILA